MIDLASSVVTKQERKRAYDRLCRQSLSRWLGKIAHGIVSVNAYGVLERISFPLPFKVFIPTGAGWLKLHAA